MPVSAATARELLGTQFASAPTGRLSKNPDQLKMFFDQPCDYYRSFRRTVSPVVSSNPDDAGLADARFSLTHTPNLATAARSATSMGARVADLEDTLEPLLGDHVQAPRIQFSSTLDQRDIGMAGDPQARLPEQISGIEGQTRLVMKQPEAFVNMVMQDPKFEVETLPAFDRDIITAAERRKLMQHARDGDRADNVRKQALSAKAKMVQTIKQQYKRGILQVDTPATDGSQLYASARDKALSKEHTRCSHRRQRCIRLEREQNRHGKELLQHSETPCVDSHRPTRRSIPQASTFQRVFGDNCGVPPGNPFDADANSRFQYSGDRKYDIISGKRLPYARAKPQYAQFPETLYMNS